jgi:hypothetical protein
VDGFGDLYDEKVDDQFKRRSRGLGRRGQDSDDVYVEMWVKYIVYSCRQIVVDKEKVAKSISHSVRIDYYRKKGRRQGRESPCPPEELPMSLGKLSSPSAIELVDDRFEDEWALGLVPKLLDTLCPPKSNAHAHASFILKRMAFELWFGEGMADEDIAPMLGVGVRRVQQCRHELLALLVPLILALRKSDDQGGGRAYGR